MEDFKNMTHQEFYEKHWLIDGKKPPPLTDFDKKLFEAFDNLKEGERIEWRKTRGGYRLAKRIQDKTIQSLGELPDFLKFSQKQYLYKYLLIMSNKSAVQTALETHENLPYWCNDQLNTIRAIIPYLQHRKEVALDYERYGNPERLKLIENLNENIKKILAL
jgi:hypothetical protein